MLREKKKDPVYFSKKSKQFLSIFKSTKKYWDPNAKMWCLIQFSVKKKIIAILFIMKIKYLFHVWTFIIYHQPLGYLKGNLSHSEVTNTNAVWSQHKSDGYFPFPHIHIFKISKSQIIHMSGSVPQMLVKHHLYIFKIFFIFYWYSFKCVFIYCNHNSSDVMAYSFNFRTEEMKKGESLGLPAYPAWSIGILQINQWKTFFKNHGTQVLRITPKVDLCLPCTCTYPPK